MGMGSVASNQSRLMTLTSRLHDLELRAQQITNTKMINSMGTEAAATKYSDACNAATDSETGMVDETKLRQASSDYDKEMAGFSFAEKLLDLELNQINTEHTAAKTEYDSVKSLISDNTEGSFSLFG
ncbi:hypothetical protein IJ818_01705 [bacterium]|nr:hypothetical protein [bacterium]